MRRYNGGVRVLMKLIGLIDSCRIVLAYRLIWHVVCGVCC